jgi:hypothetical protein
MSHYLVYREVDAGRGDQDQNILPGRCEVASMAARTPFFATMARGGASVVAGTRSPPLILGSTSCSTTPASAVKLRAMKHAALMLLTADEINALERRAAVLRQISSFIRTKATITETMTIAAMMFRLTPRFISTARCSRRRWTWRECGIAGGSTSWSTTPARKHAGRGDPLIERLPGPTEGSTQLR